MLFPAKKQIIRRPSIYFLPTAVLNKNNQLVKNIRKSREENGVFVRLTKE